MTIKEKALWIIENIKKETSTDPTVIFRHLATNTVISIHGPEHHILDGACILMAYHNKTHSLDIDMCLEKIMNEGLRMPGAMCGLWGVCGAIASMGAALAIIDSTGPLSTDGSWGDHMTFTSAAIKRMGEINGPRCCKRDAMIGFETCVDYIEKRYGVKLEITDKKCIYSNLNAQCIQTKCPYYK